MRWTTGVGIVLGSTAGALAALMSSPEPAPTPPEPAPFAAPAPANSGVDEAATPASVPVSPAPLPASAAPAPASSVAPAGEPSAAVSAPASAAPAAAPALSVPSTLEALHKAMILCDQKKIFDECTRVSLALDLGTTGPADPEQAKRFRKIAVTHLVSQCEAGSAHACFVLAAKYRAGTEMAANPSGASILEKRALDLCRHNSAPECPNP